MSPKPRIFLSPLSFFDLSSTCSLPQDAKWLLHLQASHKYSRHQKVERQKTAQFIHFISIYHEITTFQSAPTSADFLFDQNEATYSTLASRKGENCVSTVYLARDNRIDMITHCLSPRANCHPNNIKIQLLRNKERMEVE